MNNLDQSLNYPTMSGLKSLELDELTTDSFISDTIDGNLIYLLNGPSPTSFCSFFGLFKHRDNFDNI